MLNGVPCVLNLKPAGMQIQRTGLQKMKLGGLLND